jgi:hypothetical protein
MVFGELVFILKSPPAPLFQRGELEGVVYIILSAFRLPIYGVTNVRPVGRISNAHPAYWWMRSACPPYITILCAWSKTALAVLKCNS